MATPDRNLVIVTGAASGMGLAVAQQLYSEGYSIAIVDISQEKLDAVAKDLEATEAKGKVWARATDISDASAVDALVSEAVEKLGPLYGLAHFAGILGAVKPLHEQDLADMQRVVNVNLYGTIFMDGACIKQMRKQGNPPKSGYSIVNAASFMHNHPVPGCPAYSATKGAVITLTRCLAKENGDKSVNIRVNSLIPGGIATGMTASMIKDVEEELPDWLVAQKRWGLPSEIANMASFLLSANSSFSTGSEYAVDGGRFA